jgi:hypothetical protein
MQLQGEQHQGSIAEHLLPGAPDACCSKNPLSMAAWPAFDRGFLALSFRLARHLDTMNLCRSLFRSPKSSRCAKNKSQTNQPWNSHYDWYRKGGQVNSALPILGGHLKTGLGGRVKTGQRSWSGTELFYPACSPSGKANLVRQLLGPHFSRCP